MSKDINTRRQAAVSRRQNFTVAIFTECLPIALIWVVLVYSSPAIRQWAEHNFGWDLLITVIALVILDRTLPWHRGGNRKPRW